MTKKRVIKSQKMCRWIIVAWREFSLIHHHRFDSALSELNRHVSSGEKLMWKKMRERERKYMFGTDTESKTRFQLVINCVSLLCFLPHSFSVPFAFADFPTRSIYDTYSRWMSGQTFSVSLSRVSDKIVARSLLIVIVVGNAQFYTFFGQFLAAFCSCDNYREIKICVSDFWDFFMQTSMEYESNY